MSDPIRPDRLVIQAKALAGYGAGRGRPSATNHRRAVSAVYYALFHLLLNEVALQVLPDAAATDDDRRRAARWIQHADVKRASGWVVACAGVLAPTATPPSKTGVRSGVWEFFSVPAGAGQRVGAVPAHVRRVARTFVDLQDARHKADYDHLESFPKATAQRHVNAAENAMALLDAHRGEPYLQRYLAVIAFTGSRLK